MRGCIHTDKKRYLLKDKTEVHLLDCALTFISRIINPDNVFGFLVKFTFFGSCVHKGNLPLVPSEKNR